MWGSETVGVMWKKPLKPFGFSPFNHVTKKKKSQFGKFLAEFGRWKDWLSHSILSSASRQESKCAFPFFLYQNLPSLEVNMYIFKDLMMDLLGCNTSCKFQSIFCYSLAWHAIFSFQKRCGIFFIFPDIHFTVTPSSFFHSLKPANVFHLPRPDRSGAGPEQKRKQDWQSIRTANGETRRGQQRTVHV